VAGVLAAAAAGADAPAWAGWDRASGRIPADSPLVHTPARNLPPADERPKPTHYCPVVGV
jgi:hypothetical protein